MFPSVGKLEIIVSATKTVSEFVWKHFCFSGSKILFPHYCFLLKFFQGLNITTDSLAAPSTGHCEMLPRLTLELLTFRLGRGGLG